MYINDVYIYIYIHHITAIAPWAIGSRTVFLAKALWFTSMMSKRLSASSMVIPSSPSFFTKPGILNSVGVTNF